MGRSNDNDSERALSRPPAAADARQHAAPPHGRTGPLRRDRVGLVDENDSRDVVWLQTPAGGCSPTRRPSAHDPGPLVGRRVCPSRLWWRAMSVLPETDRRASQSGKGTDADVLEQRGWRSRSTTVSRVRSSCFLQPPTSSPMVGGVVFPFRSLILAATRRVGRRQRLSPRVDLDLGIPP